MPEIIEATEDDNIRSIGIDTGTLWWLVDHQAHLERVQKASNERFRERLQPVEYARPNAEGRTLLAHMRNCGKNLVIAHHLGQKRGPGYEPIPGNRKGEMRMNQDMVIGETWSGFTGMGAIVDVVCRSRLEVFCTTCKMYFVDGPIGRMKHTSTHNVDTEPIPTVEIETCGYTLRANKQKYPNASFNLILNVINAFRSMGNGTSP
jgi:hypothetical protein